ncbi:MAG: cyclase family protein [Candidatus Tectomicrobia bacterium]|nr:cyclase family protein [Candidatus Tectomicrobia bacterium]
MSEWVDLTLTLGGPRMSVVPGHPPVRMTPINTHKEHHRSNTLISMSIHCGTHVDCPRHFVDGGTSVDEMPLDRYMGRGVLADLRGKVGDNEPVTLEILKPFRWTPERIRDKIVVLYTGWVDKAFGTDRAYVDNPYMAVEVAEFFVEAGVRAIAVDFTVDKLPPGQPPRAGDCPIHRIVLPKMIPLIENLTNLHKLVGKEFELYTLPIKIYQGDGAATRAVARILGDAGK